jgi:hypothetical protein
MTGGSPTVTDIKFESPSDCASFTATETTEAFTTELAGIGAVSSPELTNVVACTVPFQVIADCGVKFVPLTVNRKAACPAATVGGETLEIRAALAGVFVEFAAEG